MPPKKTNVRKARRMKHSPRRTKNTTEQLPVVSPPGRKRIASKVIGDNENEGRYTKKARDDHDKYCFICHKIGREQLCSTCQRAYHDECLSSSKKPFNNSQECYQCQLEEDAKLDFKSMPFYKLKELFEKVIRNVAPSDSDKLKHISDWPSTDNNLVHIMDIERIIDRCRDELNHYETPVELLGEFKWIHHNCVIIHGETAIPTKSAKSILLKCQFELDYVRDCVDCYQEENDPENFLNFCDPPHPIVWAKVKGYSYWPAKCLRVVDSHARVRFFFTHQSSSQVKDCLFMSKNYPSMKGQKKPVGAKFSASMVELKDYIRAFENKYGKFPYEPENTVFNYEKGMETMKEIHDKFYASVVRKTNRPINRGRIISRIHIPNDVIDLTEEEDRLIIKSSPPSSPLPTLCNDIIMGTENSICDQPNTDNYNETGNFSSPINGQLLPGIHIENADASSPGTTLSAAGEANLPEQFFETNISIANVMSAGDVPHILTLESETSPPEVHCQVISSIAELQKQSENNTIDSIVNTFSVNRSPNLQQTPASDNTLSDDIISNEEDDEVMILPISDEPGSNLFSDAVLNMIAAADPASNDLFNKFFDVVREYVIQFWVRSCGSENLVHIVKSKDIRINSLKEELKKAREANLELQCKLEESRQNATYVISTAHLSACKKALVLEDELRLLREKCKCSSQITNPRPSVEVQTELTGKHILSMQEMSDEDQKYLKSTPFCRLCYNLASIHCCWTGNKNINYCSKRCQQKDNKDHSTDCCRNTSINERKTRKSALELSSKCHQESETVATIQQQKYVFQKVITNLSNAPQQVTNDEDGGVVNTAGPRTRLSNACSTSMYACTSQSISITSNKAMPRSDPKDCVPEESEEDSD